jgi:hypothetical protein
MLMTAAQPEYHVCEGLPIDFGDPLEHSQRLFVVSACDQPTGRLRDVKYRTQRKKTQKESEELEIKPVVREG